MGHDQGVSQAGPAHARPEYYGSMLGYLRSMAPASRYGDLYGEQDGLINRLVEASPIACLYPHVPRAYHVGFVGCNRPGRTVDGPLADRIAALQAMAPDEMNARAEKYRDIRPIDLTIDHRVERFTLR